MADRQIMEQFVGASQCRCLRDALYGEERDYFRTMLRELIERIHTMPKTYEQDGKGDAAVVYLHYFVGGCDWWITERDQETEQLQAFGLADLGQGYPELGYISIQEITQCGAELDLHWTPKPLSAVRAELHKRDEDEYAAQRARAESSRYDLEAEPDPEAVTA